MSCFSLSLFVAAAIFTFVPNGALALQRDKESAEVPIPPSTEKAPEPFTNQFPGRAAINYRFVSADFNLTPKLGAGKSEALFYRPALARTCGVSAGYGWLAGSISFNLPAPDSVETEQGASRFRDYLVTYYTRKFGAELHYMSYKGFFIENSENIPLDERQGRYFKAGDVTLRNWGATIIWAASDSPYSLSAALDQGELQERSGASVLLLGTFRHHEIDRPSQFVPGSKSSIFGADGLAHKFTIDSVALGVGAGALWTPSVFFASGAFAVSAGYQNVLSASAVRDDSRTGIGLNTHLRLGAGINTKRWFVAGNLLFDIFRAEAETISISMLEIQNIILVGARF